MSEVSEWLTEVLAGHERDYAGDCSCSEYILEVPWEQHVADALAPIVEQMLAEARAEALRGALGSREDSEMLRAMLLDAADRLGNPDHRGNRHAWPEHARMMRSLAKSIVDDNYDDEEARDG